MNPSHQQIQQLAHDLWEAQGRPDGRSAEHWAEAERRLAADAMPDADLHPDDAKLDAADPDRPREELQLEPPAVEAAIRYRGEANGSTR